MADLPEHIIQALERARAVADAAVAMLDHYPQEYRASILESLLAAASGGVSAMVAPTVLPDSSSVVDGVALGHGERHPEPLGAVAAVAGVDQADLERIVDLADDGFVKLLLHVDGRSVAERANRAAAIYCFIKEHGFAERDVGIEELRRLCVEQQAYNAPNFARYLQQSPWLLVIGEPRSRKKKFRLSPRGDEQAKAILRDLVRV